MSYLGEIEISLNKKAQNVVTSLGYFIIPRNSNELPKVPKNTQSGHPEREAILAVL
jgi:hypothetical protein